MTITSKKEFFASMFAIDTTRPWSLIGKIRTLSERFAYYAKEINPFQTHSFKKKMKGFGIWLLVVSILTVILSLTIEESLATLGGAVVLSSLVYFFLLGAWKPNYEYEQYYRRNEISQKVLSDLQSYLSEVNEDHRKADEKYHFIKSIQAVDVIKTTVKNNRTTHPIDYMLDDAVVKYWNEIEKPRLLDEQQKARENAFLVGLQLEKEIRFCKNIK